VISNILIQLGLYLVVLLAPAKPLGEFAVGYRLVGDEEP
jgi:hypothetical protein